jgi:chromosome segregation ATPase
VVELMNRFDTVEREFRARLEQASNPTPQLLKTVALRSQNPDLWDIEREYQRIQAQQSAELAQQRARVVELMGQLESLEPSKLAVMTELATAQARYENALANAKDNERSLTDSAARMQARVRQLEPLESQLEAARRDLAQAQTARQANEQAHSVELANLQTQLAFLQPLEAQVEQLHSEVARSKRDLAERDGKFKSTLDEREREAARWKSECEQHTGRAALLEARCASLEADAARPRRELEEVRRTLEVTRNSQAEMQREYDRCRSDLVQSEQRGKHQAAVVAEVGTMAQNLRAELEQAQRALNEKSAQRTQFERELASTKAEIESARSTAQASQAKAASLELTLEQVRKEFAASSAATQAEIAMLNNALGSSKTEVERQRARITAHSHHVEAAWSVLSELKPMLESLEKNLKVDASAAPAPAQGLDLSILDDPTPHKKS